MYDQDAAIAIKRFVAYVAKNPGHAADPALLKTLTDAADADLHGRNVALIAPMAPFTWETRVILPGATTISPRQPLIFPRPVDIVGFYPSVIATTNTVGLITPSLNDIDISIDTNSDQYFSAGSGVANAAGGAAGAFVTLAAIGVQVPILKAIKLHNAQPDLGMTFRWKRGPGFYQDCFISVAVYVHYES